MLTGFRLWFSSLTLPSIRSRLRADRHPFPYFYGLSFPPPLPNLPPGTILDFPFPSCTPFGRTLPGPLSFSKLNYATPPRGAVVLTFTTALCPSIHSRALPQLFFAPDSVSRFSFYRQGPHQINVIRYFWSFSHRVSTLQCA